MAPACPAKWVRPMIRLPGQECECLCLTPVVNVQVVSALPLLSAAAAAALLLL